MKSWMVCLSMIISLEASAALPARVEKGDLKVHAAPHATAKVLFVVPEGSAFEASNYPIEGFYKIRLEDGSVGWAPADQVTLYDPETQDVISKPKWGRIEKSSWFLRPHGGVNLFSFPTLLSNFPNDFTSMGMSLYGGLDFQYLLYSGSGFFIGADYITWSATGTSSSNTYSMTAIPIFGGLVIQMIDAGKFTVKLDLGGGMTVMSKLSVVSSSGGGTSYITPLLVVNGMGKLEMNYLFSQKFGFFLEGGFRVLFSGGSAFSSDDGVPASFTQDMTMLGPTAAAGFIIGL